MSRSCWVLRGGSFFPLPCPLFAAMSSCSVVTKTHKILMSTRAQPQSAVKALPNNYGSYHCSDSWWFSLYSATPPTKMCLPWNTAATVQSCRRPVTGAVSSYCISGLLWLTLMLLSVNSQCMLQFRLDCKLVTPLTYIDHRLKATTITRGPWSVPLPSVPHL